MTIRVFPKSSSSTLFLVLLTTAAASVNGAPSPAPAPAASAAPAPSASVAPLPGYGGVQQSRYINDANTAFTEARDAKFQAFMTARTAFETAGGIDPKGLDDKANLAARRDLLTKLRAAADDHLAFTTTQDDAYRAELAKTPLTPNDVDSLVADFSQRQNTPRAIKLQQIEKDLLACSDEMLSDLDKWFGKWSVTASDKVLFKKKANTAAFIALQEKYNGLVAEMEKVRTAGTPSPSPSASPQSPAPASPAP